MQQQLWLSVVLIYSTLRSINADFHDNFHLSIPRQTYIESTGIGTETFAVRSNTIRDNKKNNFTWNGGIILTHESNVQSIKGRAETSIASTRCGNLMFVGFNSAQGFCFHNDANHPTCPGVPDGFDNGVSHYSVSLDAGKTWKYMYGPPPLDSDIYARGTTWLSMGGKSCKNSNELLYFANTAANKTTAYNDFIGLSVHVARIMYKNNDPRERAVNFEWVRASLIPKIEDDDFLDKPAIAADPFDANKAYISYTQTGGNRFGIEFYATHDSGASWQGPVILQETLSNRWNQFSYPVVGANGYVYVIWYEFTNNADFMRTLKYQFVKSSDGGVTFSYPPTTINPESINFNPIVQPPIARSRNGQQPQPTMDIFTTVYDYYHNYLDRIIVAWSYSLSDSFDGQLTGFIDDNSTLLNSINIGISYSDDSGATWQFINPFKEDIPNRFVKRIFPTVSVSSDGRSVNVAYLEVNEVKKPELPICDPMGLRTSLYHDIVDTYYIHSNDGGMTWSDPIKLNDESVDWCTTRSNIFPNYGGYMLGISDSKGHLNLAGVTNGFTEVPGFDPPLTAVDVIYYDTKQRKIPCNKGIYNALINGEHNDVLGVKENVSNNDEFDYAKYTFVILLVLIVLNGMAILYHFCIKSISNHNNNNK